MISNRIFYNPFINPKRPNWLHPKYLHRELWPNPHSVIGMVTIDNLWDLINALSGVTVARLAVNMDGYISMCGYQTWAILWIYPWTLCWRTCN